VHDRFWSEHRSHVISYPSSICYMQPGARARLCTSRVFRRCVWAPGTLLQMMYQIYSRFFGTTIHWIPDDRGFALDGALWRLDLVLPVCMRLF